MNSWVRWTPGWLHSLSDKDRDEVVYWLQDHHIDPDICAEFETCFDPHFRALMVRCKMYRTEKTTMGLRPVMDRETMEPLYDSDQVFAPRWTPKALRVQLHP